MRTSKVGEQSIYKLDLKITSPKSEAVLKDSKLSLSWDAYTNSAYYKISLRPEKGDYIYFDRKIDDTKLLTDIDLVDCKYSLKVEAYNSNDVKIAESSEDLKFSVSNNNSSCQVDIISPKNKSTVSPNNVLIKWEKHPLAVKYIVYAASMKDGKCNVIVNFAEVSENEYLIDKPLEPGEYNFTISCKNKADKKIAESNMTFFTVK